MMQKREKKFFWEKGGGEEVKRQIIHTHK